MSLKARACSSVERCSLFVFFVFLFFEDYNGTGKLIFHCFIRQSAVPGNFFSLESFRATTTQPTMTAFEFTSPRRALKITKPERNGLQNSVLIPSHEISYTKI
jgi:hypothetical protein